MILKVKFVIGKQFAQQIEFGLRRWIEIESDYVQDDFLQGLRGQEIGVEA